MNDEENLPPSIERFLRKRQDDRPLPPREVFPVCHGRDEGRVLTPEEDAALAARLQKAVRLHNESRKVQPTKLEKMQSTSMEVAQGVGAVVFGCALSGLGAGTFLFVVLKTIGAWVKVFH